MEEIRWTASEISLILYYFYWNHYFIKRHYYHTDHWKRSFVIINEIKYDLRKPCN